MNGLRAAWGAVSYGRRAAPAAASFVRVLAWLVALLGGPASEAAALASVQDTAVAARDTTVIEVRGLRVEVPRPVTTTGGTSAVEVSLDSAGVIAAPTMEEFLRHVPTLQIRANSRGEAQPDLRGAEDRQIAVLLDGVPITVGWDHRTDLSVIPLTAFRNMRLLRGLSSMLHGPNVLGGAIEFDVGRGSSVPTAPPPFVGAVSVDHEGGRNATAAAGTLIEGRAVDWTVRGGVGYRASPGASLPGGAKSDPRLDRELLADADGRRLNSDRLLVDGFLSSRLVGRGGAWFSGLAIASDMERGVPPEAHVADPRLWRYPDRSRLFLALTGGTGRRETRWGEGEAEASFGLNRTTVGIDEFDAPSYATKVDGETGRTTTLTGRLLGDHAFAAGPEVWSALTVASVSHTERFASGEAFDYRQLLWSLGAETEIRLGGGGDGVLNWTVGASVDGASTPRSGDKEPLGTMWDAGARTGVTRSAYRGRVLYHLGVSRRTRFPSLRELYSGALGRFQPNPRLRPENMLGGEAGVTYTDGGTQLQTVGFYNRLGDGIVRTSTVTPTGARFKRVNRDLVTSAGVEALAAATAGRFDFGGSLTLQRVRVHDPTAPGREQRAEYTPAVTGTLNLGAVGPGGVAVSGFLRFRGVQYCENVEVSGLDRMASSATVDLEARRGWALSGRAFGHSVAGSVGVANLTDVTVLDQCGLPQPGRTFRIQFNVR